MFDGGYGVFGAVGGGYEDGAAAGQEAAAPLLDSLAVLQAMPDPNGELVLAIAYVQRKLGKAKGGGGTGGGVRGGAGGPGGARTGGGGKGV